MTDPQYDNFRNEVNNHPRVVEKGERLSKISKWGILRDSILIFLFLLVVILLSVWVFYPENFKDNIDNHATCEPFINITNDGDINNLYNNVTCNNVCPAFPTHITFDLQNESV